MNDDEGFGDFVSVLWPQLVRTTVLLGCPHADAEDLVQTTLERCLVKWERVRQADDQTAYVHGILFNTIASSKRRRWNGELATAHLPDRRVEDETSRVDDGDAMLRALQRLPHDQRTVLVLRYYSHFTERQMASALGVAAGTIKSRLSRALKALAEDSSLTDLRGAR